MKISVVIAAYKGEKFIAAQLDSLLKQTRLPDEIVISDDTPDDRLAKLIEAGKKEFPSLIYHRNVSPLGVNANFHQAAEFSSGELIFFCDQDDVWLPGKIARMEREFQENPGTLLVMCFSTLTDENLIPWRNQDANEERFCRQHLNDFHSGNALAFILRNSIGGNGHNIAVTRAFFEMQPFWGPQMLYDNWLFCSAAALGKCRLIPERLTLHRSHGDNITLREKHEDEKDNTKILSRFRQIRRGQGIFNELQFLLNYWDGLKTELPQSPMAEKIPHSSWLLLDECIHYLKLRISFCKRSRFSRFLIPGRLLTGYWKFGNGIRSLLRDLFL